MIKQRRILTIFLKYILEDEKGKIKKPNSAALNEAYCLKLWEESAKATKLSV